MLSLQITKPNFNWSSAFFLFYELRFCSYFVRTSFDGSSIKHLFYRSPIEQVSKEYRTKPLYIWLWARIVNPRYRVFPGIFTSPVFVFTLEYSVLSWQKIKLGKKISRTNSNFRFFIFCFFNLLVTTRKDSCGSWGFCLIYSV
jgi:hypothetical protein